MKTLLLTSFLVLTACETASYLPKPIEHLATLDFKGIVPQACESVGETFRAYYIGHYRREDKVKCYEDHITQTGSIAYQTDLIGFKYEGSKNPKNSTEFTLGLKPVFADPPLTFEAPLETEENCKDGTCRYPILTIDNNLVDGLCTHAGYYFWNKGSKIPSFSYMIESRCYGVSI